MNYKGLTRILTSFIFGLIVFRYVEIYYFYEMVTEFFNQNIVQDITVFC